MEPGAFGNAPFSVTSLCLGTMMFGDQTDADEAGRIVDCYREAGGNFLDTADQYAGGRSEEILADIIAPDRASWVLASKVGNTVKGIEGSGGLARGWIETAIDASLKRLGTDYLDLYYLHLDDESVSLQEPVAAMGALIEAGKIRSWGFSNFRGWKIAEMVRIADTLGVPRPVAAQPYYHAFNRLPEIDYLAACAHFGIGVVPYSPLARGVLTGKYGADGGKPEGSRAARNDPRMMETEFRKESFELAQQIVRNREGRGLTSIGFALNWVLANATVQSVLIGPRTLAQTKSYIAGLREAYTREDEALLDALVPSGHASTPGYNDPRYPYRGRIVDMETLPET